ncbi:MAG: hypothetical protein IPM96_18835 [Ignavibacteria bacterium]|nr:hypothetical protein [Ignavibacteria bacterium]
MPSVQTARQTDLQELHFTSPQHLQTDEIQKAVAAVFSVIRNCSVPRIFHAERTEYFSTRWRNCFRSEESVYYFENVLTPNTFWVDITKADFSKTLR